ncbi:MULTISPECIES: hypothetical protein [Mycolicibacterium]|uniref:Secreted protein n=1 Tax=Mycolicibacterium gilvum (strain DSM 45189 / LMG 24558 / Spyr1) TaxID=278137 RepID=E6TJJ4_MYCSR|nr:MULTISPECIES: hypothetical protein [Mycolicibacterium]ADU01390.1 hypothetical protein Mspyr1_48520 [Mycolicibacterium gilvum Spyr1]MBV5241932.1 hypothetical protein [Mycolicibacterium sp. PAM1]
MALINTRLRRYRLTGVAAAFAAAPLLLSAAAHAQPVPQPVDPRTGCESPEVGGVFSAVTATHAECQYIVTGSFYYDTYDNGVYTGTLVYRDGAKVPTERPQIPEAFTMPGGVPLLVPFETTP